MRGRITRRRFGALFLAAGTVKYARSATNRIITDCRGREVAIGPARRIVSIGGTITETLYDLGASDRIIAVDITSTFPEQALKEKKSVGYMRALSSEGVLALGPDLVLAMNDSGPPAALDQLAASSTPVVFVDSTPSPEAIAGRTRFLADLTGEKAAGEKLCAAIEDRFRALASWRAAHPVTKRVLFVMRMTNGRAMAAGTGTAADAVIRLAGTINAGSGMTGYKILDSESLIALRPDVILTMAGAQGADSVRTALLADPGFRLTPAGRSGSILSMEGERLLGFGPRTPQAALELARAVGGQPA